MESQPRHCVVSYIPVSWRFRIVVSFGLKHGLSYIPVLQDFGSCLIGVVAVVLTHAREEYSTQRRN